MSTGVIVLAIYAVSAVLVVGAVIIIKITGKSAPKWLIDEQPHDKYDEPK